MFSIFGTGTRQVACDGSQQVAMDRAVSFLRERNPTLVISGMAEGWDAIVALAAIEVGIPWDAYIPNRGYGRYYWADHSVTGKNRLGEFEELLSQARNVQYTSDAHATKSLYVDGVHINLLRNIQMVDNSDLGMAWNKTSRGTAHCISYARIHGVPVVVLGPDGD